MIGYHCYCLQSLRCKQVEYIRIIAVFLEKNPELGDSSQIILVM